MKKYLDVIKSSGLFNGVSEDEIPLMLGCLDYRVVEYRRGEYVFRHGDRVRDIAVLVCGELHIQRDDFWGNRTIIERIAVGDVFGEANASTGGSLLPSDVCATCDSTVVLLDAEKVLSVCSSACRFHSLVVRNLFHIVSDKNRSLVRKMGYISRRTTRDKLVAYLSDESGRQGSSDFSIPFNRQQLADYLAVDRSAMSKELCRMRDEGMISFERNSFRLLSIKESE